MFYYLGTPYSQYPAGITEAHRAASRQAALLIAAGIAVYSPICHTHPIAVYGGLDPMDHDIWLPVDLPLMRAAHGLIVCKLDGWNRSRGLAYEIKEFQKAFKPIVYMEPGVVPVGLKPEFCLECDDHDECRDNERCSVFEITFIWEPEIRK